MIIVFWRGWGFPLLLLIGIVPMIACHVLNGNLDMSAFRQLNPEAYWRYNLLGAILVTLLGAVLNRWKVPKEERRFSKAKHTVFGIPIEYISAFWMLTSLSA